jgi:hypothetical protein
VVDTYMDMAVDKSTIARISAFQTTPSSFTPHSLIPVWRINYWGKTIWETVPIVVWVYPPPSWKPWKSSTNPWIIWVAPKPSTEAEKPSRPLPWRQVAKRPSPRPRPNPTNISPTPSHLGSPRYCAYAHKYINLSLI